MFGSYLLNFIEFLIIFSVSIRSVRERNFLNCEAQNESIVPS